jgi:hypothetical protein
MVLPGLSNPLHFPPLLRLRLSSDGSTVAVRVVNQCSLVGHVVVILLSGSDVTELARVSQLFLECLSEMLAS